MNSHSTLAKFIHWTFTLLYAYGIFKQVDDLSELEDASLLNFEIFFAIIFLILVLVRYFYMKDTPTEQLLKDIKEARRQPKDLQKIRNELVRRGIV